MVYVIYVDLKSSDGKEKKKLFSSDQEAWDWVKKHDGKDIDFRASNINSKMVKDSKEIIEKFSFSDYTPERERKFENRLKELERNKKVKILSVSSVKDPVDKNFTNKEIRYIMKDALPMTYTIKVSKFKDDKLRIDVENEYWDKRDYAFYDPNDKDPEIYSYSVNAANFVDNALKALKIKPSSLKAGMQIRKKVNDALPVKPYFDPLYKDTRRAIVKEAEKYLGEKKLNNSTGKYDKVVWGVRSLLEKTLLQPGTDKFNDAVHREVDRLLKKYNLTKDAEFDIEKYTNDPETTMTRMGKSIMVELSENDERNSKLISALKKAGFKQKSSFRFTKDASIFKPGDKFKNKNGAILEIDYYDKNGDVQYRLNKQALSASEKGLNNFITKNGYTKDAQQYANTLSEAKKIISKLARLEERYVYERKQGNVFYFSNTLGDDVGMWDSNKKIIKMYDSKTKDSTEVLQTKNGYTLGINNGKLVLAFKGETLEHPHMWLGDAKNKENMRKAVNLFDEFANSRKVKDAQMEKEYSFSIKIGGDLKRVRVKANNSDEALEKVKKEAIRFKADRVKTKFDNNKLSTRDLR